MGTVSGTFKAYPDACLIWIDAHAVRLSFLLPRFTQTNQISSQDINTPNTTESGNLHGCPVSFLMGLDGTDIPEFSWIEPVLKKDRLVYIGLRDIDAGERKILKEQSKSSLTSF